MDGFSADNLTDGRESRNRATAAMGDIQMDGFSADNLTSMVEKVTSGATASLERLGWTITSSETHRYDGEGHCKTTASLGKIK